MNRILILLLIVAGSGLACNDKEYPGEVSDQSKEENTGEEKTDPKAFFYLALGDSYTIGESVNENQRFPVQLVNELRKAGFNMNSAQIVARTGWTTDELVAAIKNESFEESYNIVTLLIGVNNQYRGRSADQYRDEFKSLLQTAIQFAGNKAQNVIVISIPDYGVTPFGKTRNPEAIAKDIDEFNAINLQETQHVGARYVNITDISREVENDASLVASDGLHPSGKMYRQWVERILPEAKEILESQR